MGTVVIIKRGNEPTDYVLHDGEMAYCRNNREFYIGDGKTPMNQLKPFMSLIAGEDNKVYTVRVDKEGNAHVKPVICYAGNRSFDFKVEE
jgi:hypothetical protein